ncbi:hypothetical protein FPZ42_05495 [Mucilaginibacter achroorhodeus]|uniref:DUF4369 domain-containing protein n=1 Tax=Mucilaginibacter achroorhodeus TaxID=2599294 RepID=A0A563UBM9_9SPHI|nr:thioredoxin-like domain-containing protein [Mucilaginibacter achroorhodeus]TWR28659.1 hypothetical protein FPZ42_05495 [Mucilaginibacter achroorhodeus]
MKRYAFIILIAVLTACKSTPKLQLTITDKSIANGKITLSQFNETILTQNIKDGEGKVAQPLAAPGYYDIAVTDDSKPLSAKRKFTLYLENVDYNVEPQAAGYPTVTTNSKTQQQLSAYYQLENEMAGKLDHTIDSMVKYLDTREVKDMQPKERAALYAKTRDLQQQRREMEPKILTAYLKANPNSQAAAHILAEQYLDEYAQQYADVYSMLTDSAKNTDDGIKVGNKVAVLVKLIPGSVAADIVGQTTDGKPFDKKAIKAKVILVEFWKSGSPVIEQNHAKMANGLILTESDRQKFATISVSIDTDKATWLKNAPKSTDKWIQVSDLKGNESPNVANWKIKAVPTYFLLDDNWRLLQANIALQDVDQAVHDYFNKK